MLKKLTKNLQKHGFRAKSDLRNEKIGFKIREHTLQKVPYLLVVGDREVETNTLSVRTRSGKDLGTMSIPVFSEIISAKIAERGRFSEE